MADQSMMAAVTRAVTMACPEGIPHPVIEPGTRLVADLGFDSLRIAVLSLHLERELQQPVLLNEWLAGAADVEELTVSSLARHLTAGPGGE